MTTLVTGAAGFLGRAVTRQLLAEGVEVVALDIAAARLAPLAETGATTVVGDLGRWNDVVGAITEYEVDRIIHCGALLSAAAEAAPTAAYAANANGTHHVLEASRMLGVSQVVFTSTMATFGRAAGDPVVDDAPQWPTTIYGATKVFGERLVEYHHRRYGLDTRALRFPSVVGYGRGLEGASGYSSAVFDLPARGQAYALYVAGDVRCQLLHVDDAVRALLEVSGAPATALTRRIYNIGGIAPTATELIDAVRSVVPDADLRLEPDPDLEAIVRSWPVRLDDSNAQRDWGWRLALDDAAAIARRVRDEAGAAT